MRPAKVEFRYGLDDPRAASWDNREDQSGWMTFVVENRVCGLDPFRGVRCWFSSVEVAIESREVAAGKFKAEPMAFSENIARRPEVD